MTKRMRNAAMFLGVLFLHVCSCAQDANASRRLFVNLGGGISVPFGTIDAAWNPGWNGSASLEWQFSPERVRRPSTFLLEAEHHVLPYDYNGSSGRENNYTIWKYGIGLKSLLSDESRKVKIYLAGTTGLAYASASEPGAKVYLQPAFGILINRSSFLDLRFIYIPRERGDITVLGINGGVRF